MERVSDCHTMGHNTSRALITTSPHVLHIDKPAVRCTLHHTRGPVTCCGPWELPLPINRILTHTRSLSSSSSLLSDPSQAQPLSPTRCIGVGGLPESPITHCPLRTAHRPSPVASTCVPPTHHHRPLRQPSPTTVLETKCPGTHNCISPANDSYCLMELFWKTRRPSKFSSLCLRP